jgi:hypothetical protein
MSALSLNGPMKHLKHAMLPLVEQTRQLNKPHNVAESSQTRKQSQKQPHNLESSHAILKAATQS